MTPEEKARITASLKARGFEPPKPKKSKPKKQDEGADEGAVAEEAVAEATEATE